MRSFLKMLSVIYLMMICIVHSGAMDAEQAEIYYQYLRVQGYPVVCLNNQGEQVPMLLYKDTNYIPVRTAGEWMGKVVSWDEETSTISLSGSVAPIYNTEGSQKAFDYNEHFDKTKITLAPHFKILVDGQIQTFYDANSMVVYPFISHGTVYLPLRSIGNLTGMDIAWRQSFHKTGGAQLVYLRTSLTDAEMTECQTYLSELAERAGALENILYHEIQTTLRDAPEKVDIGYWQIMLTRLRQAFDAIRTYPPPTVPLLDYGYYEICETSKLYDKELTLAAQALEQGDLSQVANMCFSSGVTFGDTVAYMQNIYDQPNTKN